MCWPGSTAIPTRESTSCCRTAGGRTERSNRLPELAPAGILVERTGGVNVVPPDAHILLDESVPERLGALLIGHTYTTVQKRGWAGLKNGKLLAAAAPEFDLLLTADKNMEFQQNLRALPVAIVVMRAHSNRIEDLAKLVPRLLSALETLQPRTLARIAV